VKHKNSNISFSNKTFEITQHIIFLRSQKKQWVFAYHVLWDKHHFLLPKQLTMPLKSVNSIPEAMLIL